MFNIVTSGMRLASVINKYHGIQPHKENTYMQKLDKCENAA